MRVIFKEIRINEKRFLSTMKDSSCIGATQGKGLNRLALSKEDQQMRDLFVKWLKEAQLDVRIDDFGNIYGHKKGKLRKAPPIVIGSHLDTQPNGGKYDGILGVLAGLEVIRTLNDNEITTDYPIEIVNFTNEEGARFEPPMLGSGGIANIFERDFIYNIKDVNGVTFKEALREIGYLGLKTNRLTKAKAYVELHIEQGPILDCEDISIGVVEGVQGMSWIDVAIIGEKNHAGPTPMYYRKDALLGASNMIFLIYKYVESVKDLKVTIGRLNIDPNIPNVIPGRVQFSIDIRHPNDDLKIEAIENIKNIIHTQAKLNQLKASINLKWDSPAVYFSENIKNTIESMANSLNYSTLRLYSGPGHDAKYMQTITDSGMIFVKSKDGISHREDEFTSNEDLIKGVNVLLQTVLSIAQT